MDINSILQTVVYIVVSVVAALVGKYTHDKNAQNNLQQSLDIASQYAKDIVINLSQRSDLTNSEKFKQSYLFVVQKLKTQGIHVTEQTITNKIVEAYQTYKKDGGDIHKFIPDYAEQQVEDAKQAVAQSAENATQTVAKEDVPVESEVKVDEPKVVEPAVENVPAVDELKVDQPKTDSTVSNSENAQSAPVNPYIK